jgi:hypothetical protein
MGRARPGASGHDDADRHGTAPEWQPVGERVELGRYTTPDQERILYGQRIDGVVRITDVPASGRGRAYLVERELERDGYDALKALVADYLDQAARLGQPPSRCRRTSFAATSTTSTTRKRGSDAASGSAH